MRDRPNDLARLPGAFAAQQTSAGALAANTWTIIAFGTLYHNRSGWFNGASRWVCQRSGLYLFSGHVGFTIAAAAGALAALYKNGAVLQILGGCPTQNIVNPGAAPGGSIPVEAAAGDFFEVYGYCSSAINLHASGFFSATPLA